MFTVMPTMGTDHPIIVEPLRHSDSPDELRIAREDRRRSRHVLSHGHMDVLPLFEFADLLFHI